MAIDRNKISRSAESFVAAGRIDRAIEEFLKLIEDRPDDFNLMNRVGDAYLQAAKVPEAVDLFKKAGAGFERGGFNAKATAVFKKAHRVVPEDLEISARLAELFRQTNMIREAIQVHIDVADLCTRKGLFKRALEEFGRVVELDPKNLKNKVKLADLYNKEGMKDEAVEAYLEVAEALAQEQMNTEAGQLLERVQAMSSAPQVFLTQARISRIQQDPAGAAGHLREGLQANPRHPELLDALAGVELEAGRPREALEALAQVPQLPERSLLLCERALRDLAKAGRVAEGLGLFKAIGRDLARRGLGEAAARTLRAGLQGALTQEAWLQLGEIAHQGGNRGEEVDCLRHAAALAEGAGDPAGAEAAAERLRNLGVRQDEIDGPIVPEAAAEPEQESAPAAGEADAARRAQLQKLQYEAAQARQARHLETALESYTRILDLDPANLEAIEAVADIHRSSGMLTKVQMHYVRVAEKVAALGMRPLAFDLLDRAEAMFPGSTRLYRRTLGLMLDAAPPAAATPAPAPVPPPSAVPEAVAEPPLIPLDLDRTWGAAPAPEAAGPEAPAEAPELSPAGADGPGQPPPDPFLAQATLALPLPPTPEAVPEPAPADYDWSAFNAALAAAEDQPEVAEDGPRATQPGLAIPALAFPEPATPVPSAPPAPAEAADLAPILSDIDFQLDYGSPEEARIEIGNALALHPGHPELLRRWEQAEQLLASMGGPAPAPAPVPPTPSFFDLTDVLGDALVDSGEGEEMHDATHMVEKMQSVDELFNAFRDGVEKQVKGDDYDTHYNLGIAYKEMALLEPAIEEFKVAMRDPERTLECCSMLAICEQGRGDLDAAADWLRQGIEAPGFPPEDALGLRYDLGVLLQGQDRRDEAQEQFRQVFAQDPDYRDVARMMA